MLFYFIYLFSEKGEGREKERERNLDWLPLARALTREGPTMQACAQTGNQRKLCFVGQRPTH